ncbi:DnaJ family domain-containing protein [Paenibacillus sp. NPDC056579]|uniref:DnaJ family domain-containing protein n=1 Tax=Paenibacillus sp. NPDC056579 TaxID=3345871 RepID=UPI00368B7A38
MFRWWRSNKESAGTKDNKTLSPQLAVQPEPEASPNTVTEPLHSSQASPANAPLTDNALSADNSKSTETSDPTETRPPMRKYGGDWMDKVIAEERKKGTLDHLPGLGKPLHLHKENSMEAIVNDVLKTAHFLPPWIQLQHEIRDDIARAITKLQSNDSDHQQDELDEINQKISKYNKICPIPHLQKVQLTRDNITIQYEKWT